MHSNTTTLMEIIGLPYNQTESVFNMNEDILLRLLPSALENKIPLLFLEHAVSLCENSKSLKAIHQDYLKKSRSVLSLMEEISKILVKTQTNYVVFKTFKPFPFVTVDIDILFFGREEFVRAYRELRQSYKLAGYGAYSISLYDPKHDMNLDLHLEISVSRMVYINKQLLQRYVTEVNINGSQVSVLEPPAALATVIAHSLYKEQMLTLSDYYTIIIQMLQMTKHQHRTLVDLAEQLNMGLSLKLALNLVNTITIMAFGRNTSVITDTAKMIQIDEIEEKAMQVAVNHFVQKTKLPYKYHPISVALAFTMKTLKDPITRSTMTNQFVEIITNTSKFLESALLHIRGA